ncbi:unnamed protein product [Bursaphelenchus xylophilus]|uniref:(pine wood nematode) hypothetical protein n=1 Tax=Bursaphelenchus xylophilus TaxID=6326 RepID=A0A1I7SVC5_BURXY|nr:unnamed protein product [Bursaphelenchus xylophilus]CAG9101227.1 unnamed protein product [Bursaphelenchus xylophilus]
MSTSLTPTSAGNRGIRANDWVFEVVVVSERKYVVVYSVQPGQLSPTAGHAAAAAEEKGQRSGAPRSLHSSLFLSDLLVAPLNRRRAAHTATERTSRTAAAGPRRTPRSRRLPPSSSRPPSETDPEAAQRSRSRSEKGRILPPRVGPLSAAGTHSRRTPPTPLFFFFGPPFAPHSAGPTPTTPQLTHPTDAENSRLFLPRGPVESNNDPTEQPPTVASRTPRRIIRHGPKDPAQFGPSTYSSRSSPRRTRPAGPTTADEPPLVAHQSAAGFAPPLPWPETTTKKRRPGIPTRKHFTHTEPFLNRRCSQQHCP